jgi:hypothetical protein
MRIGNNELNENEAEWATKFADEIANQACKQCISALNANLDIADVKKFLAYVWSRTPEPVVEPEVEEEEPIGDEEED